MTPPLFTPYETRIELRCRGGLLNLPDSFWHESASLCGARVVSDYKGVGVRSYILSLSSLFVFDTRVVLICCSQKPFDRMLTFWSEVFGECSPNGLFIEKRCNPFEESNLTEITYDGILSPETVAKFGFPISRENCSEYYSNVTTLAPSPLFSERRSCLRYKSFVHGLAETPSSYKVAMMFSPASPLKYSLIEECISELPTLTMSHEFHFTPSGFSSNHVHSLSDTVQGYSTVHYSEDSYLSIECCTFDREIWYEGLLFDSLVRTIASNVLPKEVVVVPDWSIREPVVGRYPLLQAD